MTTRLVLDRSTVVGLAAGLVMLQVLIFSAGFLLGAADGVQALTPPDPPLPVPEERGEIRLASLTLGVGGGSLSHGPAEGRGGEGRGGGLSVPPGTPPPEPSPAPAVIRQDPSRKAARPSPLAKALFLVPTPAVRAVRRPARLPRSAETYAAMIREAAERHSVSPALVEAIARVESGFNSRAVSHKGARGLMQVMPATGRRFGVRSDKLFDPEHNLNAGVAYLAWLSKRYRGNLDFIVAAYNAGEGAVDDHGGVPPYRETRSYVRRVRAALRSIEDKALAAEPQRPLADAPPQPMVEHGLGRE